MNNKQFISDVYGFKTSEQILDDFFWPVSHKDYLCFYNELQQSIWDLISDEKNDFNNSILRIISTPIVLLITHIVHADMLVTSLKKNDYDLSPAIGSEEVHNPNNLGYNLYEQVWNDVGIDVDNRKYTWDIIQRQPLKNSIKWLLSQYRKKNGMEHVILSTNPLLENFIAKQKISPFRPYPVYWWLGYPQKKLNLTNNQVSYLYKKLVETFYPLYSMYTENLHVLNYIDNVLTHWVTDSVSRLNFLLQNSTASKISNLYTATQGPYGTKLISQAVLLSGGRVHSFAHGQGKFWFNDPRIRNTELLTLGVYHDHTSESARRLRELSFSWKEQSLDRLEIISGRKIPKKHKMTVHKSSVKTVMLIASGYLGDRRQPASIESCTQLNLELRISRLLIDSGFQLLIKVHPKGLGYPKKIYSEVIPEANIVAGWFEQVHEKADAFVFYNFASTALCEAISLTSKPIALIHPVINNIYNQEMDILKKRCKVIMASYDAKNKISFNNESLLKYLAKNEWKISDEIKDKFIYYVPERSRQ
jgi:hypothetical protein